MKRMKKEKTKAGLQSIEKFLEQQHMAVVGVSRNKSKFGNTIFKELKAKGYRLYPVHPTLESFDGLPCFNTIADLPPEVTAVVICAKPGLASGVVREAHEHNIRHIWLQQGAQNDAAVQYAADNNLNLVHRECILMFAEPSAFIHKLHGSINKLFGIYPR